MKTTTGMSRKPGSACIFSSNEKPVMSGRKMSSMIGSGQILPRQRECRMATIGGDHLESLVPRQADEHARIMRIVFNNKHRWLAGLNLSRSSGIFSSRGAGSDDRVMRLSLSWIRGGCSGKAQRQIKRERASFAERTGESDFPAQQRRQFARNGQTQTRAAVFAAGAGVGLLKRLEDQLLFFRRDADAGVADFKRNDASASCFSAGWSVAPSRTVAGDHADGHMAHAR